MHEAELYSIVLSVRTSPNTLLVVGALPVRTIIIIDLPGTIPHDEWGFRRSCHALREQPSRHTLTHDSDTHKANGGWW